MAYHDDHECTVKDPHVHPEDFEAVGDGVTDDTAAFQAAIYAAYATGAHVELAGRTYRCVEWGS